MKINFIFIGEGTSDASLVPHLEQLCILCGATATGTIPNWKGIKKVGHSVSEKIKAALQAEPNANLLFIHRDADRRDPTPPYEEIALAIQSLGVSRSYVAVVPIQETEAWLLLNEEAIRGERRPSFGDVAGKPKGRMPLNLPSPKQAEKIANPKERLKKVLAQASGFKGRRLKSFQKKFSEHRRKLLETSRNTIACFMAGEASKYCLDKVVKVAKF